MLPADEGEDSTLDAVVIVKRPDSITKLTANRIKSDTPKDIGSGYARDGGRRHRRCRCQHNDAVRQRHNATQTPDPILNWSQTHICHRRNATMDCCSKKTTNSCCSLINDELKSGEVTCHCHITHHCHHYSPGSGCGGGIRHKRQCEHRSRSSGISNKRQHRHQHHHHHHYRHLQPELHKRNKNNNVRQLPGYNSKSSFDSSDDLQQSGLDAHKERLQEIAIEIDAASMTEDNTSTATSNFPYKMAMGNIVPIKMAPPHLHDEDGKKQRRKQRRRLCDSMNSNSTAETEELSHENFSEKDDGRDFINTNIQTEYKTGRGFENSITTHATCCDDSRCCVQSGEEPNQNVMHNECVKIRRKLFRASATNDCCSTCSHCSNCSCQNADATSCSSIDDLDVDDNDEEQRMAPHELVVAAECHRCTLHCISTTSTGEEEEEDADTDDKLTANTATQLSHPQRHFQDNNTTDSSAHTSRRSSASYCSCHSSTCCCCECNCAVGVGDDDCDTVTTGQMHTARDTSCTALTSAADLDAEHSSTLTPLTNASSVVSTPGAEEADMTLRSLNNTLSEDVCSSLSQSAEYFSLSSGNHQNQLCPIDTPTRRPLKAHCENVPTGTIAQTNLNDTADAVVASRKPCKHYIKHHRHKRVASPLDCYL